MLRNRGWGWVLLAMSTTGCGSSEADRGSGYYNTGAASTSGGIKGGQTGSLAPECGTTDGFKMGATLPSGDTAFVYYDDACASDAAEFGLSDANGDPVEFRLEELPGGGVALIAEEALTAGSYKVQTPEGESTVVVAGAAPLPTTLGTLSNRSLGCEPSLALTFTSEVRPYLSLLSLSYSIDGGPERAWFDYGTLSDADEVVQLDLGTLAGGVHQLRIFASIAGESESPDVLAATLNTTCEDGGDGGGGCAVVAARPVRFGQVAWPSLALLVFGLWRRRRLGR